MTFPSYRIVRLAVLDNWQRREIGTKLVAFFEQKVEFEGCGFVGTSFGLTAPLLKFWQRQAWRCQNFNRGAVKPKLVPTKPQPSNSTFCSKNATNLVPISRRCQLSKTAKRTIR